MALPVVVGSRRLGECWGLVRSVLNKLKGIKADLVRAQTEWQSWGFPKMFKALQVWKDTTLSHRMNLHPSLSTQDYANVFMYNKVQVIKEAVCIAMISLISHFACEEFVNRSKTGNKS